MDFHEYRAAALAELAQALPSDTLSVGFAGGPFLKLDLDALAGPVVLFVCPCGVTSAALGKACLTCVPTVAVNAVVASSASGAEGIGLDCLCFNRVFHEETGCRGVYEEPEKCGSRECGACGDIHAGSVVAKTAPGDPDRSTTSHGPLPWVPLDDHGAPGPPPPPSLEAAYQQALEADGASLIERLAAVEEECCDEDSGMNLKCICGCQITLWTSNGAALSYSCPCCQSKMREGVM